MFKGVFLDQADLLLQAAGLRGCALVTSAGKSSSWKEDFFFAWVEYADFMASAMGVFERQGNSSSFKGAGAAVAAAGVGFTLRTDNGNKKESKSASAQHDF